MRLEIDHPDSEWTLLAELDQGEMYEVDITAIYHHEGTFYLATASGCSCWAGEYDIESFDSLDALAASAAVTGDDRTYQPSPRAMDELLQQALNALADKQPDSLDAAWAEAEAAAAPNGRVEYVEWESPGYRAAAAPMGEWHYGRGDTPTAALRALTAKLKEAPDAR